VRHVQGTRAPYLDAQLSEWAGRLQFGLFYVDALAMRRPPRRPGEPFLPRRFAPIIVVPSLLLAFATLVSFGVALAPNPSDLAAAQTTAFVTLALAHLGMAWPLRSMTRTALGQSPLSNPTLLGSVLGGAALLLVLVYTHLGNTLFHTGSNSRAVELALESHAPSSDNAHEMKRRNRFSVRHEPRAALDSSLLQLFGYSIARKRDQRICRCSCASDLVRAAVPW